MQRRSKETPRMTSPHSRIVEKRLPVVPAPASRPVTPPALSTAPTEKQTVAQMIATVGEAYRALPKPSGEVPAVVHPLRAAKNYLASDELHLAMMCARQAWTALKNIHKTKEAGAESYEVIKGDTLWRIARDHSPVHQGPGWVTIWRVNKRTIKDFNRIEVGWNLSIPDKPSQYIEPYWRPRQLASARRGKPASLVVNLPEVLAWADRQKKKSSSGTSLYAYLAARETGNALPRKLSPDFPSLSPKKAGEIRLAQVSGILSFRQAAFSVPARTFFESPQYQ